MKESRLDSNRDAAAGGRERGALQVIGWIRRFNKVMHYLAGITLIGMLALTVADITFRTAFNSPVSGTVEITQLLLVVIVFMGLAHSEDLGDHITVDLIYERVGKRFQLVLDLFADVVTVITLSYMAFQLYHFGLRQRTTGAETPVLEWPIWPFVFIAALGAALYALSTTLKFILRALGEPVSAESGQDDEFSGVEI